MKTLLLHIPRSILIGITIYFLSFYVFTFISKNPIETSEKGMIQNDLKFITYTLTFRNKSLEILTDDWSYWDDSYNFVKDLNTKFQESNLGNETLRNAQVNIVVFFDEKGSVVYKKTMALEKGQISEIPPEVFKDNQDKSIYKDVLNVITNKKGVSKSIQTREGLLMYSAYPILPSTGEGPVRGALLLGRYYNSIDEEEIKQSTHLDFETRSFVNAPENIQQKLIKNGGFEEFEESIITRYQLIKDSFGNPSLYVIFKHDRVANNTFKQVIPLFALYSALIAIIGDALIGRIKAIFKLINAL